MSERIRQLEQQIHELSGELARLRADSVERSQVPDYEFRTLHGTVTLTALFAGRDTLFAIHNMGRACRWCTLWADGLNGFLPHLEDQHSVVLLSRDAPEEQQRFAHSRGWRFRMASHGGGDYIREQSVLEGQDNMPGIVCYTLQEGVIQRKASAIFGPGDLYCSIFHVLGLAGLGFEDFTPQYRYWNPPLPAQMEDGGENLR